MKKIAISLKVLKTVRKDMVESGMKLTRDLSPFGAHTYDSDKKIVNIVRTRNKKNIGSKFLHEYSHGAVRRNNYERAPNMDYSITDNDFLSVLREERAANQTAKNIINTHSVTPKKDLQEYRNSARPDYKGYINAALMNSFYRNTSKENVSKLNSLAKNIPTNVFENHPDKINDVFHRYARKKLPDFNRFVKQYSTKLRGEFSKPFDEV